MDGPFFFAPPEDWTSDRIVLPTDESHHARDVMRVKPPDVIVVIDGKGRKARTAVVSTAGRVEVEILDDDTQRLPKPQIVVYQAAAKGSKVDEVIEKLAELGATEAWVFTSNRSVARWDGAKAERLSERWRSLARSAAKQSRNPFALVTGEVIPFTELCRRVAREPLAIALWEGATIPLRTALIRDAERIALVIGPEGGFERSEAEALADSGAQLVSLGPRILRTENAAVVTTSALLFHYGLIG